MTPIGWGQLTPSVRRPGALRGSPIRGPDMASRPAVPPTWRRRMARGSSEGAREVQGAFHHARLVRAPDSPGAGTGSPDGRPVRRSLELEAQLGRNGQVTLHCSCGQVMLHSALSARWPPGSVSPPPAHGKEPSMRAPSLRPPSTGSRHATRGRPAEYPLPQRGRASGVPKSSGLWIVRPLRKAVCVYTMVVLTSL